MARFTCASQKPFCWSSLFDWMPLNNDRLPSLLNTSYCWTIWLMISNQTEEISRTVFWLAYVNLAFWPFKNCEILISSRASPRPFGWIFDRMVQEVWIFQSFCCEFWKRKLLQRWSRSKNWFHPCPAIKRNSKWLKISRRHYFVSKATKHLFSINPCTYLMIYRYIWSQMTQTVNPVHLL